MADNAEKPDEPSQACDVAGLIMSNSGIVEAGKRANGAIAKVSSPLSSQGPVSPKTECRALAQKLALQPVSKSKQDQWGLLTAVSEKARKRPQGSHIMLHNPDHLLGRTVAEVSCQFESPAVSGRHCTISRKLAASDGSIKHPGSEAVQGDHYIVCVKDSSSNGTYINNQRLRKNGAELRLQHGDILSLVAVSEHENALAFVYREVIDDPTRQAPKRKTSPADVDHEAVAGEGKRIRGITNCSSEGPVSLDDVRRLQRANEELRQQLEEHVLNTEKLRGEMRAADARHQIEVKEVRISVASQYVQQVEEIKGELSKKSSDLEESTTICAQQQTTIEDLTQRLAAAAQSRLDAEEAIRSHKCSIIELEKRLEDERHKHEKERLQAEANLQAAIERIRAESLEEQKRQADMSARLQKQQQDMIVDLQEADKENRRQAESLRSKLEAERQVVVSAEEKGRRLEVLLQEERFARDSARKKAAEFQDELRHVYKELESEKAERESARAKVESLELEMETAIRDLTLEKQRLQGARERIVLRETQLRAFHSTAAEIEALQQKQQEQLKSMLRTLEDNDEVTKPQKARTEMQDSDSENEDKVESTGRIGYLARNEPSPRLDLKPDAVSKLQDSSAGMEEDNDPLEEDNRDGEKATGGGGDWMVGDTQEQEDCLAALDGPLKVEKRVSATVAIVRDSRGTVQDESGTKVANSILDSTQVLFHGQLDITQVFESVQGVGFSEREQVVGRESRSKFTNDRRRSVGMDGDTVPGSREDSLDRAHGDSSLGRGSAHAENDDIEGIGGETMQIDDPVGTVVADTEADIRQVLEDTLRIHPCTPHLTVRSNSRSKGESVPDQPVGDVSTPKLLGGEGTNFEGSNVRGEGSEKSGMRKSSAYNETQLEKRDNTICTDDLLASEVAGSWAVSHGTPASVHGDNESSGSDERDEYGGGLQHCTEEGASQVAASIVHGREPRPAHHYHVRLEEVIHLADPINSQSSLSPATTNANRGEGVSLDDILKYAPVVESRLGNSRSPSGVKKNASDTDSSTDDEDKSRGVDISSDDDSEP